MIRKIDLLNLSPEERKKTEEKFLVTLSLISEEDLKTILEYLNSQRVQISKAREIKVLGNSKEDIAKKFDILDGIHETDIYIQDPTMINRNVIDIYKKIQYCKQNSIPYKKEDGMYEGFLFSEIEWQKILNRASEVLNESASPIEEIVTIEPVIEEELIIETPVEEEIEEIEHIDIKDYMNATNDIAELEAKTTNFESIREDLESQLRELDALNSLNSNDLSEDNVISFGDIEPESYGMGRAA